MCYNVQTLIKSQVKRAKRLGAYEDLSELQKLLDDTITDYYVVSGYAHPQMVIYKMNQADTPVLARWGLIPHWVKDKEKALQLATRTLNARGETIFEKPAFRDAAKTGRCLIPIEGFYEYHHYKGKAYPFFIFRKDRATMYLGGLSSEWVDRETGEIFETFTIVTTVGNELMRKIHNNPKASGPRMPVILEEQDAEQWLQPISNKTHQLNLQEVIQPLDTNELEAYTVRKLRGKDSVGNTALASEPFEYAELIDFFNFE